jgi:hypothetical protein
MKIDWNTLLQMFVAMLTIVAGTVGGLWAWWSTRSINKKKCDRMEADIEEFKRAHNEFKEDYRITKRKVNKIIERMIEKSNF